MKSEFEQNQEYKTITSTTTKDNSGTIKAAISVQFSTLIMLFGTTFVAKVIL